MKSGKMFSSKHLSLKAVSSDVSKPGVRVVVSKKVVNKAVTRNLIRRRIKGLFKEIGPKILVVFYVKKGVDGISLKELRKEVIYLINKVQVVEVNRVR